MEAKDFDLYQFIPPPPPLLNVNTADTAIDRPKDREKDASRGKCRAAKTGKRLRNVVRDTSHRLSSVDRTIASVLRTAADSPMHDLSAASNTSFNCESKCAITCECTCSNDSESFISTKLSLPKDPLPIPLTYSDYADRLFEEGNYEKYQCVYKRERLGDFRKVVESLVDPTAEVHCAADSPPPTSCLLHSSSQQLRQSQRSQALKVSEFTFDSRFEGGNLDRVVMVQKDEFHLFLTPDCNTRGYTQWFYFSIRNLRRGSSIRVHIMNFRKPGSPFSRDMKPSLFSQCRFRAYGTGWTRGGYEVRYGKNCLQASNKPQHTYYTLDFAYTFLYDRDVVFFAYAEPYTYTRLTRFLSELKESLFGSREISVEESTLATTVGGLHCPLLVISDHSPIPKKKVAITARVHPGETVGSFVAEGAIRFVTSSHPAAVYLRRVCQIFIVPMLNPDGVVMGNTRTGLVGVDLNRKWDAPDPLLHPVIYAAKQVMSGAVCFIDLHGHSKKDSSFTYGNGISRTDERFWASRFLPIALAKLTPMFTYSYCFFFNSHAHDKAARTVMFTENKVLHSFTLEASFNGGFCGGQKVEFDASTLRELGRSLIEAIYGLVSSLLRKSPKEVQTQESVYTLATDLANRLKQGRFRTGKLPTSVIVPEAKNEQVSIPEEPEPIDAESPTEMTKNTENLEGSDSDPEGEELPEEEKASLNEAIQNVIRMGNRKKADFGVRKIVKCASKPSAKDPVERVLLKFLGPSQTSAHLQQSKPFLRGRYLEDNCDVRGFRSSLIPPKKTAPRQQSHSPHLLHIPKSFGVESYLQLKRATRNRSYSRFPLL